MTMYEYGKWSNREREGKQCVVYASVHSDSWIALDGSTLFRHNEITAPRFVAVDSTDSNDTRNAGIDPK